MKLIRINGVLLCVLILCLGFTSTANAQTTDNLLYIVYDFDLYSFSPVTGELTLLLDADLNTFEGSIEYPTLSLDGRYIAYRTPAPLTIDARERTGGIGGGRILPDDLMVYDVLTGTVIPFAVQPDDASFITEGVPDNYLARSAPAWSPDGTHLAWTELVTNDAIRLVMADVATGAITVTNENIPPQYDVQFAVPTYWGENGIYVHNLIASDEAPFYREGYLLYDADGGLGLLNMGSLLDSEYFLAGFTIASYNGTEQILVTNNDDNDTLILIDPLTGERQVSDGYIERYNPNAPDDNSIVFVPYFDPLIANLNRAHLVDNSGNSLVSPIVPSINEATLSPDGSGFVYQVFNRQAPQLTLWMDGQTIMVPKPDENANIHSFIWSSVALRINTTFNPTETLPPVPIVTADSSDFICAGTITPRLTIGEQGTVLPGAPNNVRNLATISGSTVVGQIPVGGRFLVNEGPVCADGIVWWHVTFGEVTGWTAEGVDDEYFVEPLP